MIFKNHLTNKIRCGTVRLSSFIFGEIRGYAVAASVVWLGDQGLGRNMIGKLRAKKLGEEVYGSITGIAKDCEGICVLYECSPVEAYYNNQ